MPKDKDYDINDPKAWRDFDWDDFDKELSVHIKPQKEVNRQRANSLRNKSDKQRKAVIESNKKQYADGTRTLPDNLNYKGRNHDNSNKPAMSHPGEENGMFGVRLTGEKNGMFGKNHTDDYKKNHAETASNREVDQHCDHCNEDFTKQSYGQHHGDYCTQNPNRIVKERKPMKKSGPQAQLTCPHCGKQGGEGNMKRYHMDNCKSKQDA